jgi:hypothetical protein
VSGRGREGEIERGVRGRGPFLTSRNHAPVLLSYIVSSIVYLPLQVRDLDVA